MKTLFKDRHEAARSLARHLEDLKGTNPLVLGIPRGAVPMAKLIADELGGEVDVILVKKITSPREPELALGSVTEDGEFFLSENATMSGLSPFELQTLAHRAWEGLRDSRKIYHKHRPALPIRNRHVIIVDDGVATGHTMLAAIGCIKARGAQQITVATPVISLQALRRLQAEGVEVRSLRVPEVFGAVGYYYENFTQISDAEAGSYFRIKPLKIQIPHDQSCVKAVFGQPTQPRGLIFFIDRHGRKNPFLQFMAESMNRQGFATVLSDLLPESSAAALQPQRVVEALVQRLRVLQSWVKSQRALRHLPIAYLGTGIDGAAAFGVLNSSAEPIAGLVCCDVRTDLAGENLTKNQTPTLLIVGDSQNEEVLRFNQAAFSMMPCEKRLELLGKSRLTHVATHAARWFHKHFHRHRQLKSQHHRSPPREIPVYRVRRPKLGEVF